MCSSERTIENQIKSNNQRGDNSIYEAEAVNTESTGVHSQIMNSSDTRSISQRSHPN